MALVCTDCNNPSISIKTFVDICINQLIPALASHKTARGKKVSHLFHIWLFFSNQSDLRWVNFVKEEMAVGTGKTEFRHIVREFYACDYLWEHLNLLFVDWLLLGNGGLHLLDLYGLTDVLLLLVNWSAVCKPNLSEDLSFEVS